MRHVGHRQEQPVTFSASAALLIEGARFNDELRRLPTGEQTFIRKGVYRFKTHAEANHHDLECLAAGMAQIALERLLNRSINMRNATPKIKRNIT